MWCKITKGSIRYKKKKRGLGAIIELNEKDFSRLSAMGIVESHENMNSSVDIAISEPPEMSGATEKDIAISEPSEMSGAMEKDIVLSEISDDFKKDIAPSEIPVKIKHNEYSTKKGAKK